MMILQMALLSIASGAIIYFAVKFYVVALSAIATKPWPQFIRQVSSTFVYLALIPVLFSPLMLLFYVFYVPGEGGLTFVVGVWFLYIVCLVPSLLYWHRHGKAL
jgi:hypothetical protein